MSMDVRYQDLLFHYVVASGMWTATTVRGGDTYHLTIKPTDDRKAYTWTLQCGQLRTGPRGDTYSLPIHAAAMMLLMVTTIADRKTVPSYGRGWMIQGLYYKNHPSSPYMSSVKRNLRDMAGKAYANVPDYVLFCAYYNTDVPDLEQEATEDAEKALRAYLDDYMDAANKSQRKR